MTESDALFRAARQLLSGAFNGILSTQSQELPGYPFGSLVPYSLYNDGWPLLLMSHLSKHTQNIEANRQCSITLVEKGEGDVQKLMRLCAMGDMEPAHDLPQEAIERHFRYFPDSRVYFEQLNFRFYRFIPKKFHCVGGFGAARWMGVDRLTEETIFRADQEVLLIREMTTRHLTDIKAFLIQKEIFDVTPESSLEIIGFDRSGIDLKIDDNLLRTPYPTPITRAADLDGTLSQIFSA